MKAIAKNSNNTNNVENPTYEEYWPDIEGLAQRGVMTDESKQFYTDDCEGNIYAQRAYEGICSTSLSGYNPNN